ncbi:MAG: hypothetical protein ABI024_10750 [Vicinamibacterales bacterium]
MTVEDERALEVLEQRFRAILPEEYQDSYEDVQPVSMGSAGLRFGADGKVAWNEMWATFCDLAMAGGPPHKGTLLEPASRLAVDAQPAEYAAVIHELCRGVRMVSGLPVHPSVSPGWISVSCESESMAGWLLRAITVENVAVRAGGAILDLPAAPHYRIEKEIKNVVTVIAKTCHYWMGHLWQTEQQAIGRLFDTISAAVPLVVPAESGDSDLVAIQQVVSTRMADAIHEATSLSRAPSHYASWLGIEYGSVRAAVWMMRMLVVSNVLSRREGSVLFVPVNAAQDPEGTKVANTVAYLHRLASAKGLLSGLPNASSSA